MRAVVILGFLCGIGAGIALFELHPRPLAPAAQTDALWSDFAPYAVLEEERSGNFDLLVPARLEAEEAAQASGVRILLHYADKENYIAFTVEPDGVSAIRVEAGLATPLARAETSFPLAEGAEGLFRLKWRDPQAILLCDGRELLTVDLTGHPAGKGGAGAGRGGVRMQTPFLQPVEPLVVSDDFMRGTEESSEWRVEDGGAWEVRGLDNPSRSSNAFVYQCIAPLGSAALLGREHWDRYRVSVSAAGPSDGSIGLLVAAKDAKNGFLFRWGARPGKEDAPSQPDAGRLQLLRLVDGAEIILAEADGGYRPGQWYRLEAIMADGRVQGLVDGHLFLAHEDPALQSGCVGLYARGAESAEFDDMTVRTYNGRFGSDPFPSGADGSPVLLGRADARNYALTATLSLPGEGAAEQLFLAGCRDPLHYLGYAVERDAQGGLRHRLYRSDAPGEALAEAPLVIADLPDWAGSHSCRIRLSLERGVLRAEAGNAQPLFAFAGPEATGRTGFLPAAGASVSEIAVEPLEPPLPIASINEIFDDERLMKVWSGQAADWRQAPETSEYPDLYWHQALFFGEVEVEAALPADGTFGADAELALSFAKPMGETRQQNGYVARLFPGAKPAPRVLLLREGAEAAAADLPVDAPPARRLRARQAGGLVLVSVDDRPVLAFVDPEPLRGEKVAWAARGLKIDPEMVSVYSRTLESYSFNNAPADWRIGAGVWEITNRWECDPRWSFWAGMPPPLAEHRASMLERILSEEGSWVARNLRHQASLLPDPSDLHAVLWHKQEIRGDMMMEVYLGQMMDGRPGRDGGRYEKYIRDFNITIAADGDNLSSGYSFLYGGWENSKSAILRQDRIVAETPDKINLNQAHRRWIRLRVERHGNTLSFSTFTTVDPDKPDRPLIDNLTFVDPEPLEGRYAAIWSYDCGILVTRTRISAEGIGPAESPLQPRPARVGSIYNQKK